MKQQPIHIDKESNPEYYALVDRHNTIMAEWNHLSKELQSLRHRRVLLFRERRDLKNHGKQLKKLQNMFLEWNSDVYNFIVHPNLILPDGADSHIGFPHYMGLLKDMRNRLDGYMVLAANNFYRCNDRYSNQVNFLIAIASFLASFAGLIIGIYTFNN
jgi:hypothetical protein